MTKRFFFMGVFAAFLLLCALSTRGAIFWLLFWIMVIMLVYAVVAGLWAYRTLGIRCSMDNSRVIRGAQVLMTIEVWHRCPLPVAALTLDVCAMNGDKDISLMVSATPFVQNVLSQPFFCPHVGQFPAGVTGVRVQDVFGLFSFYRKENAMGETFVVQPQIYPTESLTFSPGDADTESVSRAFEDATLPTDVRAYQQGDEIKKVHWKLSMRRMELLVRVYEQPMRPDALLLVDCAPPEVARGNAAYIRDAICEAAASVASVALTNGSPVRMPLLGELPNDLSAQRADDIGLICDALGRCAFDGAEQFERVLLLETRRMRRTGATAIITSRMNPVIADMILSIRRMGPKVRVLLAANVEDETVALLVRRLIRNDVEVMPISAELS